MQRNDDTAELFPSLLFATTCFSSYSNLFQLPDPQTEAFAFHQLLHHKMNLLKDESELLNSAKQIAVRFISNLITILKELLDLTIETKLQVKHKYFVKLLNPSRIIFSVYNI